MRPDPMGWQRRHLGHCRGWHWRMRRLRHGVMQPVDDRRLLGGNVDQVW
jgi:hypothetical protein